MLEYEYARSALKNGLKLETELGTNPYKFGMIGSTDAHTGLATADQDNFFGKTSSSEPSPDRASHPFIKTDKAVIMGWEQVASGYAAVWATDNTREAIFDAMQRRETYATTGPRMAVRFFGGWEFEAKDATNRMPASIGYAKGVPMGGDLSDAPAGKSPTFLVAGLRDPIGANLVKKEGHWLLSNVRDTPYAPPTNYEHLKDLEWAIGDWVDESENGETARVSFEWSESRNFLHGSFSAAFKNIEVSGGTQTIGWDPIKKQIRSWTFDDDGGFGEATCTRDGDRWVIKTELVLADGKKLAATNIVTHTGADAITWQSKDRTVDGKAVPDIKEVKMKRAK
jgi:Protein of unknown function (DUF3604)